VKKKNKKKRRRRRRRRRYDCLIRRYIFFVDGATYEETA